MGLFDNWTGFVGLPPLPERRIKIGGGWVVQIPFYGGVFSAEITSSEFAGHDEIRIAGIDEPFAHMLWRHKGAHRIKTDLPVVTIEDRLDQPLLRAQWDSQGKLAEWSNTPEAVRASWTDKFSFQKEDEESGATGLRPPQIGALHAIAAHFAVGTRFDPATVVLPTGTGKTETMLAAQIYMRPERTLVLVPSDALRSQIAGKFLTLGMLIELGTVPPDIVGPRVAVLSSGVKSLDHAKQIAKEANVIIALPDTLRASGSEARDFLLGACSDLVIDEAHHASAESWASVRQPFLEKRIVQFTATPFRQDGKRGDHRIIFNYKLGDAQAAGYYRPIELLTVEEYGDPDERD